MEARALCAQKAPRDNPGQGMLVKRDKTDAIINRRRMANMVFVIVVFLGVLVTMGTTIDGWSSIKQKNKKTERARPTPVQEETPTPHTQEERLRLPDPDEATFENVRAVFQSNSALKPTLELQPLRGLGVKVGTIECADISRNDVKEQRTLESSVALGFGLLRYAFIDFDNNPHRMGVWRDVGTDKGTFWITRSNKKQQEATRKIWCGRGYSRTKKPAKRHHSKSISCSVSSLGIFLGAGRTRVHQHRYR